jgi:hypothetical protein
VRRRYVTVEAPDIMTYCMLSVAGNEVSRMGNSLPNVPRVYRANPGFLAVSCMFAAITAAMWCTLPSLVLGCR